MTPHSSARLSPEQIARTSAYLTEMGERYASPLIAMQVLFGKFCLAALSASTAPWDGLAEQVTELAINILAHPDPASLGLDPLPVIEIDQRMRQRGVHLPEVRQILERVGVELDGLSDELRSTGRVRMISAALSHLNFPCRVASPSKEAAKLLTDRAAWFGASAVQLLDLADHLLANDTELDETDTRILALIALGELRKYRMDVGCKLLRTIVQLGVPCEETQDGVDFVALQRRRDGRYGFSECFEEKPEPAPDANLTLFLPITLNAVWLFATEATNVVDAPLLVPSGGGA